MKDKLTEEEIILLKQLGRRIREFRIKRGFSNYEHFAYDNNISRTQYGKYETGSNIQILTLLKILKGLDVSFSEFFSKGFENLNNQIDE